MNTRLKIYVFFLLLIVVGLVYVEANRPQPINWSPSFSINSKAPFGMYVFDKEHKTIFKDQYVEKFGNTIYEFLNENLNEYDTLYDVSGTILVIDKQIAFDQPSLEQFLDFIAQGNQAFLSAKVLPNNLLDTLKIEVNEVFTNDSMVCTTTNNPKKEYFFYKEAENIYFSKFDSINSVVLGHQRTHNTQQKLVNCLEVPFGEGTIILHTQPIVFTNYYLLKDKTYQYPENLLKFVEDYDILWYLEGTKSESLDDSPLRYVLKNPPLRWAWYLLLMGLVVFVIFTAKRKQRIVPIITPLTNTTVDFAKTIGNLYFQEGNHHTILDKKIIYFLEHIRNEYFLDTFELNQVFAQKLHQKSGKNLELIDKIIQTIKKHRNQLNTTEKDVIEFVKLIELFKS